MPTYEEKKAQALAAYEDKKRQALAAVQGATKSEPSGGEAFVRGAAQGATLGFADEIEGVARSLKIEPEKLMASILMGPAAPAAYALIRGGATAIEKGAGQVVDDYRKERDTSREKFDAAQEAHPGKYLGGQVLGGVATAAAGGAPATLVKTAMAGAGVGGATALGDSKADITRGEYGEAIKDTAIGMGVGVVGGVAGHGATKFVAGKKLAASQVAKDVAAGADEIADVGQTGTVRSFYEKSMALQDRVSKAVGKKFGFSPAEATGDPAAALAESAAEQFPKTMRGAQQAKTERLRTGAQYLDHLVDGIAAKPERLGKADVAENFAKAVEKHFDDLFEARSAAAAPLYQAAKESGAIVPARPIADAIRGLVAENKFSPSAVSGQLQSLLKKVESAAADGALSLDDVQNLRSLMSKAAAGKATVIDNMPVANQARIARDLLGAIDGALDEAGGEGVDALRKASAVWREHTQAIEGMPLQALNRALKVGGGEAGDTLTDKMLTLSPEQLGGVMRVVGKTDPGTAQQFRAQVLEHILVKGGKPERGASYAAQIGAAELKPGQTLSLLVKNEPKLRALYAGDEKAIAALHESMDLLQRLASSPKLRGAQTAPLAMQAIENVAQQAAQGADKTGVTAAVLGWLKTDKKLAEAVSTPDGLEAIHRALRISLGLERGQQVPQKAIAALTAAATRAGLWGAEQVERATVAEAPAPRDSSMLARSPGAKP